MATALNPKLAEQHFAHDGTVNLVVASTVLTAIDQVTIADLPSGSTAFTATLPPAEEAAGNFFTLWARTQGGTGSIKFITTAGKLLAVTFGTLDTAGDREVVWSDGYNWYLIASVIT